MWFITARHRILGTTNQTVVILINMSGNIWPFSIFLWATMARFFWPNTCSSLLLFLIVPLLPAIFQTDPLSKSGNVPWLVLWSTFPKLADILLTLCVVLHFTAQSNTVNNTLTAVSRAHWQTNCISCDYFIIKNNLCFTSKMLLMWNFNIRKILISCKLEQQFFGNVDQDTEFKTSMLNPLIRR